jgi:tRNA nucleotidyltransferase (CCA-adding enzyme)
VQAIAQRLEDAGFETWCVGGAVRDALLGLAHADWDLATAATPPEVRRLFDRTVPHGIDFGTVGVIDRAGVMHEVTTFRRDVQHDGRHAVVEYGVSLDEDLARRDFTINAIAYGPRTGELRDPFGGRDDLERGVIRAVGDAGVRMVEDRLRALRALRFAGRFGFDIEPATWQAIAESAPFLPRLSRERVRQEIEKTLDQVRCPSTSFSLWRTSGAFASLIPELATLGPAALRAPDHVAMPDDTSRPELALARRRNRLAALLLETGAAAARRVLEGLRASNRETDWVVHLVHCWESLAPAMAAALSGGVGDDAALRRWASTIGRTVFRDFVRVAAARWSAERADGRQVPRAEAVHAMHRRGIRIAYRDPIALGDLAIDGGDLMEIGVRAGPGLGALLRRLLDVVLEDPARNQRDVLLAIARESMAAS